MSGPKVIRIVTGEELIAICEQHLSRLDAMITEWKSGSIASSLTPEEVAAIAARREALGRLLNERKFSELQRQVPAEISYLRVDLERRQEKAATAAAEAKQALRRAHLTARTLADALIKAGQSVPADLQRAVSGDNVSVAEVNSAASRAFSMLSPPAASTVNDRQRALASELGGDEVRLTFADWLASRLPPDDPRSLSIDRSLAELSLLGGDTRQFEERAKMAMTENVPSRRALLADSLLVELASAVKTERDRARLLRDLKDARTALSTVHSEPTSLVARIDSAIELKDMSDARSLIESANTVVSEHTEAAAAASRRQAILEGLATLGYEATEGMSAAWVEKGRVVLRKAATPDYGVEIAGGTNNQRLQVRAVSLTPNQPRDASRDRDIETIWCREFDELQQQLAKSGGGISIERALPVGATPLKVVDDMYQQDTHETPALRTLQPR